MMFTARKSFLYLTQISHVIFSQLPFLQAFADRIHQHEKRIIISSFLNILPETSLWLILLKNILFIYGG